MKGKMVTYLCCVLMLFACVSVLSKQKEPPKPKNNKHNFDTPPPGLPIDGGLSLLLIAGAAYGVYVIRKRAKD